MQEGLPTFYVLLISSCGAETLMRILGFRKSQVALCLLRSCARCGVRVGHGETAFAADLAGVLGQRLGAQHLVPASHDVDGSVLVSG